MDKCFHYHDCRIIEIEGVKSDLPLSRLSGSSSVSSSGYCPNILPPLTDPPGNRECKEL